MVLNLVLVIGLARTNIGRSARVYHISCIISALLSFCTAFWIFITIDTVLIVDGNLMGVLYGPLLFYLLPWANDVVCLLFFAQVQIMWQLIPAPAVLQWLSLYKREMSNTLKMVLAYSLPLASYIYGLTFMRYFLPTDNLRAEMAISVNRLHGTNLSEFHVFGMPIIAENSFDAVHLTAYDVVPSYAASYALIAISATRIRTELALLGTAFSTKTIQMQRRFFRVQIVQVLLPLLLSSIPIGVLCGAAVLGQDLHNLPALFAFVMWPLPGLSALLLLGFVRKSAVNKKPPHQKFSLSKVSIEDKSSARKISDVTIR